MSFRCVRCGRQSTEGGYDELERMFYEPDAGDDNGLCDGCWSVLDKAMVALGAALVGWLP